MHTYFEIKSGLNKGLIYLIQPGFRIGSDFCELQINDLKTDGVYSQVMLDIKNRLVLVCTNAVFEILINGRPAKKALLIDGIELQISNLLVRVFESNVQISGAIDPKLHNQNSNSDVVSESNLLRLSRISKNSDNYSPIENFKNSMSQLLLKDFEKRTINNFKLFKEPFLLVVRSGPQADDQFFISWGPRNFGPLALEFPIDSPQFPEILFSLEPDLEGNIIFSTKCPQFTKVNGHNHENCVLSYDDKIMAGNSTVTIERFKE